MKTIVIVQARMGSTRLPGKTLMPLAGRPLLWHVFERARKIKNVSDVVLATTTNPKDDVLEQFAKDNNIKYHRGSESDVLQRFIETGEKFGAEGILRINADVPLLEPDEVDKVIEYAVSRDLEACYVDVSTPTAVAGFEYATLDALKKVRAKTNDSYAHEHVTVYLRTEKDFAKHDFVKPDPKYNIENYQPAIDTQKDYEFFINIYNKFYEEGEQIELAQVVAYLKSNAENYIQS
jgi:spore coat polysaccharide biosynthesis protein SpsF